MVSSSSASRAGSRASPAAATPEAGERARLDRVFHALSSSARRDLLARLSEGPSTVSELAAPLDMSLPAVSKHLRVLERAHLLERDVRGRVHRCSLQPESLHAVDAWLSTYRVFWSGTLDSLARHLEEPARPERGRRGTKGR